MITNFDFSISATFNLFLKDSMFHLLPDLHLEISLLYIANQQSIENDIKGLERREIGMSPDCFVCTVAARPWRD